MSEKFLRKSWPVFRWVTLLVFVFVYFRACQWVGHLFGLLIGASTSPIAATVTPLVFGLLAAIGIGLGARQMTSRLSSLWYAILIASGIAVFCQHISSTDEGHLDRKQSLRYLKSNFLPNGTIEIAFRSDIALRNG